MKEIKNIVFDFGGILFDIDIPMAISNMSKLLDVPNPDNDLIPPSVIPIIKAYEVGAINTEKFIWELQFLSKKTPHAIEFVNAWNSMLIGMKKDKFKKLLELRKEYKVYLLSNINDLHLNSVYRYLETQYGVTDWDNKYFEKTYYSHLIGRRKPDVSTYEYVWEDANIKPEESLFIDDTEDNIKAAQSIGINTIHHNPKEDIFKVLTDYFR